MGIMSKWSEKANNELKISNRGPWKKRKVNAKLGESGFFILHPDSLEDLINGKIQREILHFGINHDLFSEDKEIKEVSVDCSYDDDCPVCEAVSNRLLFKSEVYQHLNDELGVSDKVHEHPFYKSYENNFIGLRKSSVLLKVLHITGACILGRAEPIVGYLSLGGNFYKLIDACLEQNEELIENGEILQRVFEVTTNGETGSNVRYKTVTLIPTGEDNKFANLIPDWSKLDQAIAFENFLIDTLRPSSSNEKLIEIVGNIKMYEDAEDLLMDVQKLCDNPPQHKSKKDKVKQTKRAVTLSRIDPSKDKVITPKEAIVATEELTDLDEAVEQMKSIKNASSQKKSIKKESPKKDEVIDDEIIDDEIIDEKSNKICISSSSIEGPTGRTVIEKAVQIFIQAGELGNTTKQIPESILKSLKTDTTAPGYLRKSKTIMREFMNGEDLLYV
jgi:hypothetical protein